MPTLGLSGLVPVALTAGDRRAIFSVLDATVYEAGRSSVVLALRGSEAQKVARLGLVGTAGYGYYAGRSVEEVEACVDTLIVRGSSSLSFEKDSRCWGIRAKAWSWRKSMWRRAGGRIYAGWWTRWRRETSR
ncbi:MAG: hypothetical protein J6386_13075 [Candidatus Synoicihabitans palmerolidicus]|nr:hypothetical protein [Candidatus Synoicihabitans palmerolidicus]